VPKDEFKEDLKNVLKTVIKIWKKSEFDELKELNDKIKNEELLNKLDRFKQNSKNQIKNLAQLVELTKVLWRKSGALSWTKADKRNYRIVR
jgi:ferritin-like metal-binding protein YciE